MRDNSKTIGDLAELTVAVKYAEKGCFVCRPLTDNAPYDLVIDDGQSLKKVQIKARSERNNKISVELYTSMVNYTKQYEEGDFDLLAIYNINTKEVAVLTWEQVSENTKGIVLRTKPALNNQTKGVRLFEDYKI
jgi:hypothetical protein